MKQIVIKVWLILFALYGTIFFIGSLFEIYYLVKSPDYYISLFGISTSESHWQFKRIDNFTIWKIGTAIFYLAIAGLNTFCYKKNIRLLKIVVFILDLLVLILTIRYYLLFRDSGFDHYPGFDPYLL